MKISAALAFIIIDYIYAKGSTHKIIPVIEALIPSLEAEVWSDDEQSCRDDTLRILYGVKNDTLWATWVWDSMQPPVGVFYGSGVQLGSFEQCLYSPYTSELRTQYCLVDVEVESPATPREFSAYDSADEYLNTLTADNRIFNELAFGVCMPAGCSPSSVAKVFKHMLQLTHVPVGAISIDPRNCQGVEPVPFSRMFYAFWTVVGALTLLTIVSTIYPHGSEENSWLESALYSFCLKRNWRNLFTTSKSEIKVLHGMRFLTAFLIVVQHYNLLTIFKPSMGINALVLDKLLKTRLGSMAYNANSTVDTFFAISALLLIRSLTAGHQKNLFQVLVKRYIRLIGPLGVMTVFAVSSMRHTGSGPLWPRSMCDHTERCEKYWWKNFLMISNLKTMCHGVAWYVPCEYHLAVMTTLLFYIHRRNRVHALTVFTGLSCLLILQLGVKAYWKELPLVPINSIREVPTIQEHPVMADVYVMWQDRAGPYLVGIAMGYLLTVFQPHQYRNLISKTTSLLIVLTSLFVMFQIVTIRYWFEGPSIAVATAVATYRMFWGLAICAIIGAFEYGSLPVLSDFLGSSFFVPLSKLSYGVYMSHVYIIERCLRAAHTPIKYDPCNFLIGVLGTTVLSCVAGLYLYMIIEAPLINISNAVFSEKSTKLALNSTPLSNGTQHNGNGKLKAL